MCNSNQMESFTHGSGVIWGVILAVVIIYCIYVWVYSTPTREDFGIYPNNLQAMRVHPGLMTGSMPPSIRYQPPYRQYWYIPAHEYMDLWQNGYRERYVPNECVIPPSVSDDCFDIKVRETGDVHEAARSCFIPPSISESCPLLKDEY
jgi:hypothetical protein